MKLSKITMAAILISFGMTSHAFSEEGVDAAWKKEIERKIQMLAQQKQKVSSSSSQVGEPIYEGVHGFAPAASKVYHVPTGVSMGGYGEMIYNQYQSDKDDGTPSGKTNQIDFVRNILYVGYKFNDKFLFNSELEFEHASTTEGGSRGEVSIEFAHIDFSLIQNDEGQTNLGARTGLLLVPVGLRNELHEPTLFHGTGRPSTEKNIIPSTWRDNGAGLFGTAGPVEWRTYILAPLQGVDSGDGFDGFSKSGLRGGRTKGAKSKAADKAWVGRVDYSPVEGSMVGASVYKANTANDTADANGKEFDGTVTLWEVHGESEYKGVEVSALYAKAKVDDVTELNAANGLTGSNSIGEEMFGGYISIAFNILSLFDAEQYLAPFYRWERYDTQQGVPTGFSESGSTDVTEHTFGVSYRPHPQIVIKADAQNQNKKDASGIDTFNLGMGYMF